MLCCVQLADQFCNAIGVLQQFAPPASFSNIQTAINKDQPANLTEGTLFVPIQKASLLFYSCQVILSQ